MKSTAEIGAAITAAIVSTSLFKQVEEYPMARVNEEVFFNDLQKFKLPTCLVVFTSDSSDGRPVRRECDWTLVLVFKGTEVAAGSACLEAVDSIRADVLGTALFDKIMLRPTSRVAMLESTAAFTAATMAIKTVESA